MDRPQGRVSTILQRSNPINIPATAKRIHSEAVTFGSVPLKRLGDFEVNEMPAENPIAARILLGSRKNNKQSYSSCNYTS